MSYPCCLWHSAKTISTVDPGQAGKELVKTWMEMFLKAASEQWKIDEEAMARLPKR